MLAGRAVNVYIWLSPLHALLPLRLADPPPNRGGSRHPRPLPRCPPIGGHPFYQPVGARVRGWAVLDNESLGPAGLLCHPARYLTVKQRGAVCGECLFHSQGGKGVAARGQVRLGIEVLLWGPYESLSCPL